MKRATERWRPARENKSEKEREIKSILHSIVLLAMCVYNLLLDRGFFLFSLFCAFIFLCFICLCPYFSVGNFAIPVSLSSLILSPSLFSLLTISFIQFFLILYAAPNNKNRWIVIVPPILTTSYPYPNMLNTNWFFLCPHIKCSRENTMVIQSPSFLKKTDMTLIAKLSWRIRFFCAPKQ